MTLRNVKGACDLVTKGHRLPHCQGTRILVRFLLCGDWCGGGVEHGEQIVRVDTQTQSAFASGDEYLIEFERGFVSTVLCCVFCPSGRCLPPHSRFHACHLRVRHLRLLRADGMGELLEAHMAVDRHDADHTLIAGVGHERLEHLPFVVAEFACGFEPVSVSIVVAVFVFVRCERDLGVFKLFDGRRRGALRFFLPMLSV